MIRSNLAVVLAERKLKIADVWRGTGISRTTLQGLFHNDLGGVQFDTLNKLCGFLGVTPGDILLYYPFEFEVVYNSDPFLLSEDQNLRIFTELVIAYTHDGNKHSNEVRITYEDIRGKINHAEVHVYIESELFDIMKNMPKVFSQDLENAFVGYGMRSNSDTDEHAECTSYFHRGLENISKHKPE